MSAFKKPLAGPGYVILNVLRVMNIVALTAVMVASWVMLVKTFIISKFFFFDAISHLISASISMFLIVSELSLFKTYFARNWPLLSPSSGFVTLGFTMIIVGVSILGNLNKQATSQESLGLGFWRLVIASGIVVAILGFLNIIVSYIFRDPTLDVTARQVRSHGAVATQASAAQSPSSSQRSFRKEFLSRRKDSLPSYNPKPRDNRRSLGPKMPINISRPMNVNPQFKDHARDAQADRPPQEQHPIFAEMRHTTFPKPDAIYPHNGFYPDKI